MHLPAFVLVAGPTPGARAPPPDLSAATSLSVPAQVAPPSGRRRRRRRRRRASAADAAPAEPVGQWPGSPRYPDTWAQVTAQAAAASGAVIDAEIHRLLVRVAHSDLEDQYSSSMLSLAVALVDMLNARGKRNARVFVADQLIKQQFDASQLLPTGSVSVLGVEPAADTDHAAIVIAPENGTGQSPLLMEAVEHLHYDGWRETPRPVVIINPALVALTVYSTRESRPPSFLADYTEAYVLDTDVFNSPEVSGSLMQCYPRNWELYLSFRTQSIGYRLAAQYTLRPSREKISGDLMWRAESSTAPPRRTPGHHTSDLASTARRQAAIRLVL